MRTKPRRTCKAKVEASGEECRQSPLKERDWCFWHDPDNETVAADARRLGGQRRKREGTLSGAFELEGLGSIADLRRVLEIALFDSLALDNGVNRNRTLIAITQAGAKLLEVGEFEERLAAIESVMEPRLKSEQKGRRR